VLDILLINPSISYSSVSLDIPDDNYHHYPPLGYLYLASTLRQSGFTVDVVDTSANLTLKQTLTLIKKRNPKIIGLSAMLANMRGAYQLASEIKKKIKPSPVIILGGHHVSSDPTIIKRFPCFDIGITGEGEITLPLVVDQIINKKIKIKNTVIQATLPPNLDKIPFPARDLINLRLLKSKPIVSVLTSRGCPYNCIFCSRPAISRTIRYRSPALVVAEMIEIYKTVGIGEFIFHDDTFNLNQQHVIGICKEIIKSGYHFTWICQGRFNLVTEKTIKIMAKAGCTKIMFGVEAGNERIRNLVVGKGITDFQIKKGIRLCWKYNIEPDVFLILGFPTETKKELYDTVNFGKKYLPNMIGVNILSAYPGSALWNDLVQKKQLNPRVIDDYIQGKLGEGFRKSWPNCIPRGMTFEDLLEARNIAHRRFYLSPKYILKRISRDFTSWKKIQEDIFQAFSIFRYGQSYRKLN
jgi:radical SAM superfamily enzyme YgiQ (UPF0313 family)